MSQLYMFGSPPVDPMVVAQVVAKSAPVRETPHQRRRRGSAPADARPSVEQAPVVEPVKAPRASREKLPVKPVVEQTMWAVYTGPWMPEAPPGQKPTILPADSAEEAVKVVSAWNEGRGGPRWAIPVVAGDDAAKVVELELAIGEVASVERTPAQIVADLGDPADIAREIVVELKAAIVATEGLLDAVNASSAPPPAPPVESTPVARVAPPCPGSKAAQRAAIAADTRTPSEILASMQKDERAIAGSLLEVGDLLAAGPNGDGATVTQPLLTAIVIDDVAHINCDGVPVSLEGVLDRLRRTDRVTHTMIAEAARAVLAGTVFSENRTDQFHQMMKASLRRSEVELAHVSDAAAALCGESVESLEARYAKLEADRLEEAADAKAARKAGRRWSETYGWKAPPAAEIAGAAAATVASAAEQRINDAAAREAQYLADCSALAAEQREYERSQKPIHAPAPKRAARGSKASPIVVPADPVDVAAQSMRRLKPRQVELLAKVRVEHNRAIYGSGYEAAIPDWKNLKETMIALGGSWSKENKKKSIPGGFTFLDGVDVEETIRLAQTTGEVLDPKLAGFFATPRAAAADLVARLGIQPGWRILEPSAGTGRIAVAVREAHPSAIVACVEPLPKNRAALIELGFTLIGEDFTGIDPLADGGPRFDAVAMNPPFDHEVAHVLHAGRFLDAGGPVASIASAGVEFRTTKEAVAFRAFLAAHGGTIEAMPDGSFLESGTGVRTVIVEYKACAGCRAGTCEGRR